MRHPKVVQSPIINDCLKVNIYGHTRPPVVPQLLLTVFSRKFHNRLVIDPEHWWNQRGKRCREQYHYQKFYIVLNISTPTNKCQHNKRSCVLVNFVYLPRVYIPH